MATIPKQVLEAAEVAEAIIARGAEGNPDANGGGTADESGQEDDVPDDVPAASAAGADAEEEEEESEEAEDTWEQKYKSLEGKYKAEVPVLQTQLKDYKDQVFNQLNKIISSKDSGDGEGGDVAEEEEAKLPEPDERFKTEYGEDMYTMINAILEDRTTKLRGEIAPVTKKVEDIEETRVNDARAEFSDFVSANVKGDWKKGWAGDDPAFNEFLTKEDPSGLYTNGELLTLYSQKWDKVRFAKVLSMHYGDATAAPAQAAAVPAAAENTAAKAKADAEKAALVAPSRSAGDAPETDSGEEIIWTDATFRQFEKDDRAGKYSAEDSKKMWDSLLKALATNNIR
jgi:hypothetical protein